MSRGIPVLIDVVEAALFPQTRRLAARRQAHWLHCPLARHYRERASAAGAFKVAKQMRKAGVKLDTALSVLARRSRG